jgi:hypothetical protein
VATETLKGMEAVGDTADDEENPSEDIFEQE